MYQLYSLFLFFKNKLKIEKKNKKIFSTRRISYQNIFFSSTPNIPRSFFIDAESQSITFIHGTHPYRFRDNLSRLNRTASIYRSMSFSPECRYLNRIRNANFDYRFAYTGSRHMGHFLLQEKIWCTRSSPLFGGFGWRWCTSRIWRAFLIKMWSYLIYRMLIHTWNILSFEGSILGTKKKNFLCIINKFCPFIILFIYYVIFCVLTFVFVLVSRILEKYFRNILIYILGRNLFNNTIKV